MVFASLPHLSIIWAVAAASVLKNGRAKAVRFTTLEALSQVLQCQPGGLLRWDSAESEETDDAGEGTAQVSYNVLNTPDSCPAQGLICDSPSH